MALIRDAFSWLSTLYVIGVVGFLFFVPGFGLLDSLIWPAYAYREIRNILRS